MAATTAKKTTARKTAKTATPAKRTVKKTVRVPRGIASSHTAADEEFNAYVPSPEVHKKYVGRKVFGQFDKIIADEAMKESTNVLIEGDTGSGKTLFGEAYASLMQMPYYSVPCDVSIDPSNLFGKMVPTETPGKYRWQYGPVSEIFLHGGLLNISEINFMQPKISASLYPALDGRRYIPLLSHNGEILRAHLGTEGERKCWCSLKPVECNKRRVLIIADMNPQYRGTIELNAAFKNRFGFILPWGYDDSVEEKLVKSPTVRDIAKKIRALPQDIMTPVSTNALMEFERFAMKDTLGIEFATENFIQAFETDERAPVKRFFELQDAKLKADLTYIKKSALRNSSDDNDDDLEELEMEQELED